MLSASLKLLESGTRTMLLQTLGGTDPDVGRRRRSRRHDTGSTWGKISFVSNDCDVTFVRAEHAERQMVRVGGHLDGLRPLRVVPDRKPRRRDAEETHSRSMRSHHDEHRAPESPGEGLHMVSSPTVRVNLFRAYSAAERALAPLP